MYKRGMMRRNKNVSGNMSDEQQEFWEKCGYVAQNSMKKLAERILKRTMLDRVRAESLSVIYIQEHLPQ